MNRGTSQIYTTTKS